MMFTELSQFTIHSFWHFMPPDVEGGMEEGSETCSQTWHVACCAEVIADSGLKQRFVVLEEVGTSRRFVMDCPEKMEIGQKIVFLQQGRRQFIKVLFEASPGGASVRSFEYVGPDGERRFPVARRSLVYERHYGEKWIPVEFDGKKLPR